MASEFIARTYSSDRSTPLRFIWSHVIRHKGVGLMLIFGALSNAVLASVVPFLIGTGFDALIAGEPLTRIASLAILLAASQILRGGLQFFRNFGSEIFGQRIERDVRDELYASLLGKDMTYHDFQPVGEIMARVTNDVREMYFMFTPGVNLIVGSGMFILLPLIASPLINPQLILVPFLFLVSYALFLRRYVPQIHAIAQEVRQSFGHMNARLAETLEGVEIVKGTAQEAQEAGIFADHAEDVRDKTIRRGRVEARYVPLLLMGLATAGAFIHGAILYQAGILTTGDVLAFVGQISLFGFPVFTSLFSWSQLASGYASAERILEVIVAKTELDQNVGGTVSQVEGAIVFDDVSFGYGDGSDILQSISLNIKPGQTVALVGQTGAGKSTLAKLINRTYDVTAGVVQVDGIDVREWSLERLRGQISIIEQEIFLFSRTIAENIAFGVPDATHASIEDAAKRAQAHDFIMTFPDAYDTVIGQRGVTLSGGQRQRLAIARAFLTEPQILILDDSTSAIDSATEDQIQKAIWAAAQGRTTILITHRLSQIRWADHIVVMQKGRVAAQGNHDDLLSNSEAYRRIFARYQDDRIQPRKDTIIARRAIDEHATSD